MIKMVKHFLKMVDHHRKIEMDLFESRRGVLDHERAQSYSANMARYHRSEVKRLEALQAIVKQEQEDIQTSVKLFRKAS